MAGKTNVANVARSSTSSSHSAVCKWLKGRPDGPAALCGLAFLMTAFTVASSKRFSISGIWPCASNGSDVTFGCCSCSPTAVMPARRSACALPVAIAAVSSVGCLPRSVSSVLLSRGAAGGEIGALAALVMPPRWRACLLARIRRASGVSSRAFCRLLPANTTSQSMRPVSSPLVYSP